MSELTDLVPSIYGSKDKERLDQIRRTRKEEYTARTRYTQPAGGDRTGPMFSSSPDYLTESKYFSDATRPIESMKMNTNVIDMSLQMVNIVDKHSMDWYTKFARTPAIDPFNTNTTTREYIFITKPDLHLFKGGNLSSPNKELTSVSSFFVDALDRYKEVAKQLQFSIENISGGPFCNLLSNAFNGHLDLPGISSGTVDTPSNVYGTHLTYRGTSYESDEGFDFSIDFKDTKYLEVYMFFKMYDMYERLKWRGQVSPTSLMYIYRKILHDQMSIYKFIVGDDGMTLLYWARLVGCFPTGVPRDTFGDLPDGEITFNVPWHANFVQDMDPIILTDFNRLTKKSRVGCSPLPITGYGYRGPNGNSEYEEAPGAFPKWAKSAGIYFLPTKDEKAGSSSNGKNKYNKYYLQFYG